MATNSNNFLDVDVDNISLPIGCTKAQFFKTRGEIWHPELESYATWHKRCNMKYFRDIKERHNMQARKTMERNYAVKRTIRELCRIEM